MTQCYVQQPLIVLPIKMPRFIVNIKLDDLIDEHFQLILVKHMFELFNSKLKKIEVNVKLDSLCITDDDLGLHKANLNEDVKKDIVNAYFNGMENIDNSQINRVFDILKAESSNVI